MIEEFLHIYCKSDECVREIQEKTQAGIAKAQANPEEFADILYAMKQTEELLSAQAKNMRRTIKFLEEILCKDYAARLNSEGKMIPRSIKTEWCTATPNPSTAVPIPRPGEDRYYDVLNWLGVPIGVAKSHVIKLSWDELSKAIMAAREKGCPMPQSYSMHDMTTRMSVTVRGKQDLLGSCSNTSTTENGTEKT